MGLVITSQLLRDISTAYKAIFQQGLGVVKPSWDKIATLVPSTTATEKYGWLGQMPAVREWVGERHLKGLAAHGYSIQNRPFESTVVLPRTDVEDNQYLNYSIPIKAMGESLALHPDELVFGALVAGFSTNCYDGQCFFDTDHVVLDKDGKESLVSNMQPGAGPAWFLLETGRVLKPLIYQERKRPQFVAKDSPDDERVFMNNEFVYGGDYRGNVGYGFWQQAFGSKAELNMANLQAAYSGMKKLKGDYGRPLGLRPNLLVVSTGLEFTALNLMKEVLAGGEKNVMSGKLEVFDTPFLD
jgi:phage major head subunit gpT-like protein